MTDPQVIDKVPQSQLKRRDSRRLAPPPDVRQRLAKKLRISPLTIKSPPPISGAVVPKKVC